MPRPRRQRTDDDVTADRERQAAHRQASREAAAAAAPEPAGAAAEFRASQVREANRVSHSDSRARAADAAAAAAPEPAEAAAEFRASQAREAHRVSQSGSRARAAEAAADAAAAAPPGARLDALLDKDVFTLEDLDLIDSFYERNVSAALAFFSSNTQVAFGMRRDVDMDAQLRDVLGDPNDPNSAANGVTAETKAACIERCMKTLGQRELRACVACGVRRRPF
jgi:hypothetical protein